MKLYLMVTNDKYQLPLFVADTARELSKMCGVPANTIYCMMSKYKHGKIKFSRFICVEVDECIGDIQQPLQ